MHQSCPGQVVIEIRIPIKRLLFSREQGQMKGGYILGKELGAALGNAPQRVGDEFLLPKIVEGAES